MKTYDDAGHIPQGVALCPNGTLYVTNVDGNTISVYEHRSTKSTKTLVDDGVQVFSVPCDRARDIFVTVGGKQFQVDEFTTDGSGPMNRVAYFHRSQSPSIAYQPIPPVGRARSHPEGCRKRGPLRFDKEV